MSDEVSREQVEQLAECFPVDMLNRNKNALLGHDAALRTRLAEQTARVAELEERLEIGFAYDAMGVRITVPKDGCTDGIACRDATIRVQKQQLATTTEALRRCREALKEIAEMDGFLFAQQDAQDAVQTLMEDIARQRALGEDTP